MLQLLCSHLTPDNSTLRVIGLALNLCKHCGRRVGTSLTWIDFCRKHMRQTGYLMLHLGYIITLLTNICRPQGRFKRMWRRPSNNPIPPRGTSQRGTSWDHIHRQVGLQGVVPWLLRWKPSQATAQARTKGNPKQLDQHVALLTLWCKASRRAIAMRGWKFPCLELCFPVLWLLESVTRQGS